MGSLKLKNLLTKRDTMIRDDARSDAFKVKLSWLSNMLKDS